MNGANVRQKTAASCAAFSILPSQQEPEAPYTKITMMDGAQLLVPEQSAPLDGTYNINNLWRYVAQGSYSNILQSGGMIPIRMDRQMGSGHIKRAFLRLVVSIPSTVGGFASGNTYMLPTPLWLQQILWQTPSGAPMQQTDGLSQFILDAIDYDNDEWPYYAQQMFASRFTYQVGKPLVPGLTYIALIPLKASWIETTRWLAPAADGDIQLWLTFLPQANTVVKNALNTGSAPVIQAPILSALSLDVELDCSSSLDRHLMDLKMQRTDYIFPYVKTQRWSQIFNINTTYNLQLTSITGDCVFCFFVLRWLTGGVLTGQSFLGSTQLVSFLLLDSGQNNISGQQITDGQYNRRVEFPNSCYGGLNSELNYYYFHLFATKGKESDGNEIRDYIESGKKDGAYPFTGTEFLQITTVNAGTSEILTVTLGVASPAAGNFIIGWSTPYSTTQWTGNIAYNATATQITNAIQALSNFDGTVTLSHDFTTTGATITFGGQYQNRPMVSDGYSLVILNQSVVDASSPVKYEMYSVAVTTAGVLGMTDGANYVLDFYSFSTNRFSLTKGQIDVKGPC